MTSVSLFDRDTREQIPWPATKDGEYAKNYLLPLLQHRSDHYIHNVHTKLYVLLVDDLVLPVTVNECEFENSYVCSLYTHYISYAQQELSKLRQPLLETFLAYTLKGVGYFLKKARINQVVLINNWMLSTNLYPQLNHDQLKAIIQFLKRKFPQHVLIFRSINTLLCKSISDHLHQLGCTFVPSRQIYVLYPNGKGQTSKARWLVKRDYRLLAKHGYEIVEPDQLTDDDVPRILELYRALYLEKYSYYNPQFTEAFIQQALQSRILSIYALRKNGRIDAVLGFYERDGVMTAPLFGYDTSLPLNLGLYRMLSAVLLRIAAQNKCILHESSGAAQFKRNRGAIADIEYNAVINEHVSFSRRMTWSLLSSLLNRVGVPIMKKKKL